MNSFPLPDFLTQAGLATAFCASLMFLVWLLHLPWKNAALVDAAWPLGILGSALIFAWQGSGDPTRKAVLAALVGLWALRLSFFLFFARILGKPEEGRYQELRRLWGPGAWWKFLFFYQLQALSCVALTLPVFLACASPQQGLSISDFAAVLLWLLALIGEVLADAQLHRFKADPRNKGRVCRVGLWAWSRHPNYFFEWLHWVSYALFAWSAPWGFLGLLSPVLIYHFVNNVTGIPPTEAQALRSRGEEYARYQREVSAFFPLPPRK
jgi:steroid 5-alpha reductase family enzyme